MRRAALIGLISIGMAVAALGQNGFSANNLQRSEFSLQVTGVFTATKKATLNQHLATDSAGLLLGYRFNINPWEAVEVQYGYTRNGQRYITPGTAPGAPSTNFALTADMHELVANEVLSTPRIAGIFQPFIVAGGGLLYFRPRGGTAIAASSQRRGTFNVGAGVDFHILHLGARAEFQELIFKIPDFKNPLLSIDKWTHVAQPSVGLILTF